MKYRTITPGAPDTAKGKRLEAEAIINAVARESLKAAMLLWEADRQEAHERAEQ